MKIIYLVWLGIYISMVVALNIYIFLTLWRILKKNFMKEGDRDASGTAAG